MMMMSTRLSVFVSGPIRTPGFKPPLLNAIVLACEVCAKFRLFYARHRVKGRVGDSLPRELIGQSAGNPGLIGDTCEPVVACDDELYL